MFFHFLRFLRFLFFLGFLYFLRFLRFLCFTNTIYPSDYTVQTRANTQSAEFGQKLSIDDELELAAVSLACIELAFYIYFYLVIFENPKNGSQFQSRVNLRGDAHPFQHSTFNRF